MSFEKISLKKRSGRQVIELPDNLRIDDDTVYLKKVGNSIYVIPYHNPWESFINSVEEFSEDYMAERNQPSQAKRESMD